MHSINIRGSGHNIDLTGSYFPQISDLSTILLNDESTVHWSLPIMKVLLVVTISQHK